MLGFARRFQEFDIYRNILKPHKQMKRSKFTSNEAFDEYNALA